MCCQPCNILLYHDCIRRVRTTCNKSDNAIKLVTSCEQLVLNLLQQTRNKQCEHNFLTTCEQTTSVECDLTNNNGDDQPKHTENAANYLTVAEKGKFKWSGPVKDLKTLMNELTEKETRWSTPSGHCKLLQLDEVVVRWYSNSNSLTINGKLREDIKTQLRIVATLTRADTEVINNVDKEAVCNGEQVSTNPSTKEKDELEVVLDTVRKVQERLERRINNIASEIHETRIELYKEKMARGKNEAINW